MKSTDVNDLAEYFQNDCHRHVDYVIERSLIPDKGLVQDATNVWLFRKLAEMQLKINELEGTIDELESRKPYDILKRKAR